MSMNVIQSTNCKNMKPMCSASNSMSEDCLKFREEQGPDRIKKLTNTKKSESECWFPHKAERSCFFAY